jgi:RHS repeat-associated protein
VANPNTAAQSVTKYYPGGAMRVGGTVYYTLSDHISSTSLTLDASGSKIAEMRYKAWGEVRYANGSLQTDRTYTGQRSYSDDFGLMFYNARWYDLSIGHFAQVDNIDIKVGSTQSLDRFAYVSNNPMNRTDPTGHKVVCKDYDPSGTGHPVHECHNESDPDSDAEPVTNGTKASPFCHVGNIVDCFYARYRLPTGTYQISEEQLNKLLLAFYYDTRNRPESLDNWRLRGVLDGPTWDGGEEDPSVSTFCIDNECSKGTDVNYALQGMISAKYEGYLPGLLLINGWKFHEYQHLASPSTAGWFSKGYSFYEHQELASFLPYFQNSGVMP